MRIRTISLVLVGAALVAAVAWAVMGLAPDAPGVEEIYVPAAASLADAMTELGKLFERKQDGKIRVRFDFASSGMLRTKIEAGVSADAFISASVQHMDLLDQAGLVMPQTRRDLLGNTLVCVVKASSDLDLSGPADLTGAALERIAIGDPAHVPAGMYAAEALRKLDLWDAISGRLVHCANVRAALVQVRTEAVEAALVYLSDAHSARDVRVAFAFSSESHCRIVYPACVLSGSPRPVAAGAFVRFLASPEARAVFVSHGFQPVDPGLGKRHVD